MIDIVADRERNLKNLRQIGTPQEENKIYVENLAYSKLKEENYRDRNVFVFMGHTERMNGTYATFAEAVIAVSDMEFVAGVPRWNNKVWSEVFREIKRLYENLIIVGWALDVKGMSPKLTPELERIHREHFGGMHQIFLLMDSVDQEETFYAYKETHLIPKEGFYIYYHTKAAISEKKKIPFEVLDLDKEIPDMYPQERIHPVTEAPLQQPVVSAKGGHYRKLLMEQLKINERESSNIGVAVAAALLIFVLGVGVYENRDSLFGTNDVPIVGETGYAPSEETESTATETVGSEISSQVSGIDGEGTIPVEIIPGETEEK